VNFHRSQVSELAVGINVSLRKPYEKTLRFVDEILVILRINEDFFGLAEQIDHGLFVHRVTF
jgi:hypothetical protein